MSDAWIGLVGVAVGGLLTIASTFAFESWRTRQLGRSLAQIYCFSLIEVCAKLDLNIKHQRWVAAPPTDEPLAQWKEYRRDLALGLAKRPWLRIGRHPNPQFADLAVAAMSMRMLNEEAGSLNVEEPLSDPEQVKRLATLNRMIFEIAISDPQVRSEDPEEVIEASDKFISTYGELGSENP